MKFPVTNILLTQVALYHVTSAAEIVFSIISLVESEKMMQDMANEAQQLNLESLKAIIDVPGATIQDVASAITSSDSPISADDRAQDLQALATVAVNSASDGFAAVNQDAVKQAVINLINADGVDGLYFVAHAMNQEWFGCGDDLQNARQNGLSQDDWQTLSDAVFAVAPPDLLPAAKRSVRDRRRAKSQEASQEALNRESLALAHEW